MEGEAREEERERVFLYSSLAFYLFSYLISLSLSATKPLLRLLYVCVLSMRNLLMN